ncbi:MAG: hypothetical protein QXW47_08955 [Candidatus Jordarchaeales archaeon]
MSLWKKENEDVGGKIKREVSFQSKRNLLEKLMYLVPGYKL